MGSPIWGTKSFFDSSCGKRIDKVLNCQNHLQDLQDPQVELHLLRSCLGICKVNHLLRLVPCDRFSLQLSRFDCGLRSCLERISHSSLSDMAWSQATLPIRLGGLGIREACRSHSAAFVGSYNATRVLSSRLLGHLFSSPVITLPNDVPMSSNPPDLIFPGELQAREHLSSLLPANSTVSLFSDRQHHFQSVLDSSLQSQIKASVSLRDRARINTISAPFAGSWIRATPSSVFGLTMSPQEFVICVHLWLGISLFPPPPSSSRCFCGSILDCHGDHVLGCHSGSTRIKRHDALCDIIFHCLQANNCREQRCCSDNQSRPGDIFHPDFLRGRPAYFDLSVRNSLQQSFVVSSAITYHSRLSRSCWGDGEGFATPIER